MDSSSESRDNVLENKYKILEELGKGKTSTVYLVEHLFLNKQLAVKLFKDKYWENQIRFTRAQREAMTCAAIDHKNVVKVFDFGVTEDGAPYIVQEYISGTNLKSLVEKSGPLPLDRALPIFKQIARGLNCLHDNQVLHRDIKSENIVITRDSADKEVVKLIDLGIARLEDKDGAIQSLTQSGSHIGSPYYISPELCHGGETDNRSDIYSFGCVMYEVLSGAPPFRSESTLKTLEMHLKEEPASLGLKGVPEALDRMVLKCLAKKKEERFSDCIQILEELDRISGKDESKRKSGKRKVR
ncbi:MAG TPA: serine/threonine-protein kinase, partial [Candidatus Melainabacteria bacterium]|nr:serine/threonine-protein kinase [Candidatus Melainabacteria bacterium]